jgi:hypothetical protein
MQVMLDFIVPVQLFKSIECHKLAARPACFESHRIDLLIHVSIPARPHLAHGPRYLILVVADPDLLPPEFIVPHELIERTHVHVGRLRILVVQVVYPSAPRIVQVGLLVTAHQS